MEEEIASIKKWLGSGSINLFGRPFAGKDTQGRILAEMFNGVMISGGDILRHAQDNSEVQSIMAAGGIIPSDLFENIVLPHFQDSSLTGKPIILSEVGRMKDEVEIILKVAEQTGHPTKAVIELVLDDADVLQRFDEAVRLGDRGQRADDNSAVLQTRLDRYREKVLPVINIYREKGMLIEIDARLPREQVTKELLLALSKKSI